MPSLLAFWAAASRIPFLFHGDTLHRAALLAVFRRRFDLTETLFEAAAARYRRDLEVPALARLRVHQLIGRAQALAEDPEAAFELAVEIEHRLAMLEDLEDLTPPFALVPAEEIDGAWRIPASAPTSAASAA